MKSEFIHSVLGKAAFSEVQAFVSPNFSSLINLINKKGDKSLTSTGLKSGRKPQYKHSSTFTSLN